MQIIFSVIVYSRPAFFSLQYWLWPIFYIMLGSLLFAVPAMSLKCNLEDIEFSMLIGLNFGVLLGVISSIMPYYMQIFALIPLILIMVRH